MGDAGTLENLPGSRPLWGPLAPREPALEAGGLELARVLRPVVDLLPEAQRDLLVDAFFRGRSQRRLAADRGVTQQTVQVNLGRAYDALVRLLALQDPEFVAADAARRKGTRSRPPRDRAAKADAAWR